MFWYHYVTCLSCLNIIVQHSWTDILVAYFSFSLTTILRSANTWRVFYLLQVLFIVLISDGKDDSRAAIRKTQCCTGQRIRESSPKIFWLVLFSSHTVNIDFVYYESVRTLVFFLVLEEWDTCLVYIAFQFDLIDVVDNVMPATF